MIYKNGKHVEKDPKLVDDLKKKFDFPVTLKYHKSLLTYDPVNNKNNFPPSVGVDANSTVRMGDDIDDWRFASSVRKVNGENVFYPSSVIVSKSITIEAKDMDLLYWLYYFCPSVSNGYQAKQNPSIVSKCKFQFEDIKQEAAEFVSKDIDKITVKALIGNPSLGVNDKDLRRIAKVMFIPNATTDDINIIRRSLMMKIESSRGNEGYVAFMEAKDGLGNSEVRATLSTAMDMNVIKYHGTKKKWFYLSDNGDWADELLPVRPGRDKDETLVDYLKDEKETLQDIKDLIEARKSE